jgi:hypothetical protein
MKKTQFLLIGFVLFTGIIFFSCMSFVIQEKYIVESDPNNPYQGSWIYITDIGSLGRGMLVINGYNAISYSLKDAISGWVEGVHYIVNPDSPTEWRLSDDKQILTHQFQYEGRQVIVRYARYKENMPASSLSYRQ